LKIDLRKYLSVHLVSPRYHILHFFSLKIKALENKLETLKDISESSRQQLEELAELENQIHSRYENKTDTAKVKS
jgi:hypothetical protein